MAGTAVVAPIVKHRPRGVVRISVALACDASGVISETVIGEAYGRLVGVFYDGGLDASAVVTLRTAASMSDATVGAPLVAYTTGTEGTPVAFRPTRVATTNDGVAIVAGDGSGGGTTGNDVNRDIYAAGKLTLQVASGGVSETGLIAFVFDEADLTDVNLLS